MGSVGTVQMPLTELIGFLRVQIKRGGYSIRADAGVATCPAELMLNIEAILDAAARGASESRAP